MSNELSLGLGDIEEKVYKTLLVSGQLSIGELRVATSRNLDELTTTINSLISKNLIREMPGLGGRYACLLPVGTLKDDLLASVDNMTIVERELLDSAGVAIGQLQSTLDTQEKELQDSLNTKINEMNTQFDQLKNNFQEQVGSVKSKILTSATEIQNSNSTTKEQTAAKIQDKRTAYEIKINLVFENLNSKFNEQSANLRNELTTEINNALESIKPIFQNSVSSNQQANNESAIKINNVFNQNIEKFKGNANSFVTEAGSHLQESSNTINNSLSATSESVSDLEGNLNTQINQHRIDVDTFKTQLATSFDQITEELGNLDAEFSNQILQIEANFTATGEDINTKTKTFVEENNEKLSSATGELQSELNASFEGEITKFKTKIGDHYQKMITDTLIQLDDFKLTLTQDVANKMEEVNSHREDMRLAMNVSLDASMSSINTTINNSSQHQRQIKDGFFKSLGEKYGVNKTRSTTILDSVSSNIQGLIDTISASSLKAKTQISELQGQSNTMNTQFVEKQNTLLNTNVNEALDEISNLLGHELDSLNQLNDELANAHLASFQETLVSINSLVSSKVSDLEATLKNFHNTFISNMKQSLEETQEGLEGQPAGDVSSKSIQNEVYQFLQELSSEIENLSEISHTTITSFVDSIQSDANKLMLDSENIIVDQNDRLKDLSVKSMEQVKVQANQNKAGQIGTVKGTMDQYSEKYTSSSRSVTDKTLSLATVLEKLFNVQQDTKTPALNTSHLVGKDAIMYQVENIISRVKSKVTILLPSLKMINVDQIQKMKSTAQVNIISHIDEVTHKDWIKTMHDSDANVTLRSITKTDFGGSLPDFIGVEREGEEILLGTMDDSANEYVAITSSSEYFVQILGNIVIADYARGKSKQIQK